MYTHTHIYTHVCMCVNILYRIRFRRAKVVNHVEINTTSVARAFSARTTCPHPTRKRKRAPPLLLENNYAHRPMKRNVRTPGSRSVSFIRNRVLITIMSLGQKINFVFVSCPHADDTFFYIHSFFITFIRLRASVDKFIEIEIFLSYVISYFIENFLYRLPLLRRSRITSTNVFCRRLEIRTRRA